MRVIVHQAQTCDDFEIYDNNKILAGVQFRPPLRGRTLGVLGVTAKGPGVSCTAVGNVFVTVPEYRGW
jgi:hypothetical protein